MSFEVQQRIWTAEPGATGNRHSALKRHTQCLTHSRPGAEEIIWKEPAFNTRADHGGPPENQEATGSSRGDTDAGGSLLGEIVLPGRQWCWQVPFWSAPSSLLERSLTVHQSVQVLDTLSPATSQVGTQSHLPPGRFYTWAPPGCPASSPMTWHCPPIGKDGSRPPLAS